MTGVILLYFDLVDWNQRPQRGAMLGRGSITRSRAKELPLSSFERDDGIF